MPDMFRRYPYESAILHQRGIELGLICSTALVGHCMVVCSRFWTASGPLDVVLRWFCLARVACVAPRVYFGLRTRQLAIEAREQPSPGLVADRLHELQRNMPGLEKVLVLVYYGWLFCATVMSVITRSENKETEFITQLWRHLVLNFSVIALHRVACVLMFTYLVRSDLPRTMPPEALDKYTKRFKFAQDAATLDQLGGTDMDCSICFSNYAEGEDIRKLGCKHHFHQRCVDKWLLGRHNRCPLCLYVVGPHRGARLCQEAEDDGLVQEVGASIAEPEAALLSSGASPQVAPPGTRSATPTGVASDNVAAAMSDPAPAASTVPLMGIAAPGRHV